MLATRPRLLGINVFTYAPARSILALMNSTAQSRAFHRARSTDRWVISAFLFHSFLPLPPFLVRPVSQGVPTIPELPRALTSQPAPRWTQLLEISTSRILAITRFARSRRPVL